MVSHETKQVPTKTGMKKKRVSKKNKKSWRKHTDNKDVDSFLEDKRLEERLGVPFAERRDEELFQLDTTAGETQPDDQQTRTKKKLKPLKCFEILEIRSAVPDPIKKRNRVRTPEERKHPLVKKIEAQKKELGILKRKEIRAHIDHLKAKKDRANRVKRGDFNVDLWEDDGSSGNTLACDSQWLNPTTFYHTLKNTGQLKKKMPDKYLQKPSNIPAVQIPHPGMSYNPTYGDHRKLLEEAAAKEIEKIKEEKHLNRVTTRMFSRVTEEKKEGMWMEEMSQGLPKSDENPENEKDEGDETDNEYKAINPPVQNKKKTLKQRRKMKEARKEQLLQQQQKTEKKKTSDVYKLKFINKEIEDKNAKLEKLRQKREKIKAIKSQEPKLLSRYKFVPQDLEFNLGEEIKGNLRNLKPEGNILEDRYNSLQGRNIIEPRVKQRMVKGKVKKYEKKSHKMGWESKGY